MSPVDWATRPLKKYADFSGRAPRAEFWWFYLLMLITVIVAMIIDSVIGSKVFGPYGIVACLALAALLLPYLGVAVRRLHDTNRTGWWIAGPIVLYGIGMFLMGPALTDPTMMSDPAAMGSMGTASIFLILGGILGIVVLVFFLMGGTKGPNKYGEDPYGGSATATV